MTKIEFSNKFEEVKKIREQLKPLMEKEEEMTLADLNADEEKELSIIRNNIWKLQHLLAEIIIK